MTYFRKGVLVTLLTCLTVATTYAASVVPRNPPEAADYTVLRGKAIIKTYDHMIGIAVFEDQTEWVHLFRLWTEDAVNPLNATLESASIEYRGGEVVIMSGEPRLFFVFGTADSRFTAPRTPVGYSGVHYIGYGLNHEVRASGPTSRVGRVKPADCETNPLDCPFVDDPGGGGSGSGGSCTAGGAGSSSCTVSSGGNSCTVTCGVGYYACCNFGPLRCSCVRN